MPVNGTISYTNEAGKSCQLKGRNIGKKQLEVVVCTWSASARNMLHGGEAYGSLLIFALYFFHNYKALLAKVAAPYFYLRNASGGRLVERSL